MVSSRPRRWRGANIRTVTTASIWLFVGVTPLAGQGVIRGAVTDAESLRPVVGARVFVDGTSVETQTGTEGGYRLEGLEEGATTVSVRLAGYRELSRPVSVIAGRPVTVDFSLDPSQSPFAAERLSMQNLPVSATDVSSLLAGKVAGLSVISGNGQPGEAASIALRGPGSINTEGRSMAPLVVIDGVIQSDNATLADIGTLDVHYVEILKGAAAAALYGSRGQNGVILVAMKRGADLPPNSSRLMVRGEYGFGDLVGDVGLVGSHPYLMNQAGTKFIDSEGQEVDFRDLLRPGFGVAQLYNQIDPGQPATTATAFANQLFPHALNDQMAAFFDPGETLDLYAALSERTTSSNFRVSVDHFRESGIVSCSECIENLADLNADRVSRRLPALEVGLPHDEGYERQNVRLNVDKRFGDLDVALSGFYSRADQDDRAAETGAFARLTFMSPAVDLTAIDPWDGYPDAEADPQSIQHNPLYLLAVNDSRDKRTRTMASLALDYSPAGLDWLTIEADAAFDRTDLRDYTIRPWNERPPVAGGTPGPYTHGFLREFNFTDEAVNASAGVSTRETFMRGDLMVGASARYLFEDQRYESNGALAFRFSVPDVPNFDTTVGETTASNELRRIRGKGLLGIAGVDYRGRYILDGLVRRDGSSLFGPDERWHTYYRGAVAWRVSEEAFWKIRAIDQLQLRFLVGTAGGRPNFAAQYETYQLGVRGYRSLPNSPLNLGNRSLRPELTTEREAGLNLVLFDDLGVGLTYAWRTTDDQILLAPQPVFKTFRSQWTNAGEIEAASYEVSLRYMAIDNPDIGLHFRLDWDRTQHAVSRLDIPDFTQERMFLVSEGRPLGEIWGEAWAASCADLAPIGVSGPVCTSHFRVNDDGLLVWTGGAEFTDGFRNRLWGTSGTVVADDGEQEYRWGFPIKVRDYSPVCVSRNPTDYSDKCNLTDILPLGTTAPDFDASFAANFRYKGLSVYGLLDASVGQSIYNRTAQWALRELRGEDVDQTGKPLELNKPVGYASTLYSVGRTNSWFVEGGSWLKIRELSLSYTLAGTVVERLLGGVIDRVTFNLIGRNLFTVTDYRGYDPEVGRLTGPLLDPGLNRVDAFGYPNFRTITFAAEFVF